MFHSVRFRLTLWYSGLLAVALITFAGISYLFLARAIRAETDASLSGTANEFAAAFANDEPGESRDVLLDFRYSDREIVVMNPGGAIIAASRMRTLDSVSKRELAGRIAHGQRGLFTVTSAKGRGIRVIAVPITVVSTPYVAIVARDPGDQASRLRDAAISLALGIPLALIVTAGGGYLLARKSLDPVREMSRKAQQISAASLGERIEVRNPQDELGDLAITLNGLLSRLDEAFTSQRRFMADASHELRTPVSILQGEADVALSRSDREPAEYREALEVVQKASRRLTQIVQNLFLLSRADAGAYPVAHSRFYLDETVADCVRSMRTLADSRGIRISFDPPQEMLLDADEELIYRLVLILLDNAVKYTRTNGTIDVALRESAGRYSLSVRDSGPGVPVQDRERIFDRFYRGKRGTTGADATHGGGAGLGLAIAQWIAELHGGRVTLAESGPNGSVFVAEISNGLDGESAL
ncbi:MAG TPA: ATP-binding protein [Thermoanaerobaculia bacterium]|jgi:heavy metal sensor kinase|nr:ATP-binding protein [Thermoanaerobaculia bacterium]